MGSDRSNSDKLSAGLMVGNGGSGAGGSDGQGVTPRDQGNANSPPKSSDFDRAITPPPRSPLKDDSIPSLHVPPATPLATDTSYIPNIPSQISPSTQTLPVETASIRSTDHLRVTGSTVQATASSNSIGGDDWGVSGLARPAAFTSSFFHVPPGMGGMGDRDRNDDTTLERDTANNALPQSTHATPPSSNRPEDLLAWLNGSLSLDEDTPVPHGSPQSDNRAASTDWSPVAHGGGGASDPSLGFFVDGSFVSHSQTGSSHQDKDSSPPTHSSRHDLAVAGQVAEEDRAAEAAVGVGGGGSEVDGHTSYALLMAAVLTGDLEGARRILTQKIDLNLQHERDGRTVLHWAAESGSLSLVTLLLDHGAEKNIIDHAGRTPLHLAIAKERQHVVAELVQRGADIFLPEKKVDELSHLIAPLTQGASASAPGGSTHDPSRLLHNVLSTVKDTTSPHESGSNPPPPDYDEPEGGGWPPPPPSHANAHAAAAAAQWSSSGSALARQQRAAFYGAYGPSADAASAPVGVGYRRVTDGEGVEKEWIEEVQQKPETSYSSMIDPTRWKHRIHHEYAMTGQKVEVINVAILQSPKVAPDAATATPASTSTTGDDSSHVALSQVQNSLEPTSSEREVVVMALIVQQLGDKESTIPPVLFQQVIHIKVEDNREVVTMGHKHQADLDRRELIALAGVIRERLPRNYQGVPINVGSIGHLNPEEGTCPNKRCYWHHQKVCRWGTLCGHCHICIPPRRAFRPSKWQREAQKRAELVGGYGDNMSVRGDEQEVPFASPQAGLGDFEALRQAVVELGLLPSEVTGMLGSELLRSLAIHELGKQLHRPPTDFQALGDRDVANLCRGISATSWSSMTSPFLARSKTPGLPQSQFPGAGRGLTTLTNHGQPPPPPPILSRTANPGGRPLPLPPAPGGHTPAMPLQTFPPPQRSPYRAPTVIPPPAAAHPQPIQQQQQQIQQIQQQIHQQQQQQQQARGTTAQLLTPARGANSAPVVNLPPPAARQAGAGEAKDVAGQLVGQHQQPHQAHLPQPQQLQQQQQGGGSVSPGSQTPGSHSVAQSPALPPKDRPAEVAAFDRLVDSMIYALDDRTTQLEGCLRLAELFSRSRLLQKGSNEVLDVSRGLGAIVSAINRFPNDVFLQTKGCAAMWSICKYNTQRIEQAGQLGAVEAVTRALLKHADREDLQWIGCGALFSLCFQVAPNKTRAREASSIKAVLNAIQHNPNNLQIQIWGCGALFSMTRHCLPNQLQAGQHGALRILTQSLRMWPDDPHVQWHGYGAIWCMCFSDETRRAKEEGRLEGTLQTVVTNLQKLQLHPDVQLWGCAAVWSLCRHNAGNSVAAGKAGAVEAILGAMRTHTKKAELHWKACGALFALFAEPSNRQRALAGNGVSGLADALQSYPQDLELQIWGCGALWRLCTEDGRALEAAWQAGAVSAVLRALKQWPNANWLHIFACGLIATLCQSEKVPGAGGSTAFSLQEYKRRAGEEGAVEVLLGILTKHLDDIKLQEQAFAALWLLCRDVSANHERLTACLSDAATRQVFRQVSGKLVSLDSTNPQGTPVLASALKTPNLERYGEPEVQP